MWANIAEVSTCTSHIPLVCEHCREECTYYYIFNDISIIYRIYFVGVCAKKKCHIQMAKEFGLWVPDSNPILIDVEGALHIEILKIVKSTISRREKQLQLNELKNNIAPFKK
jgi:hypothetical protein